MNVNYTAKLIYGYSADELKNTAPESLFDNWAHFANTYTGEGETILGVCMDACGEGETKQVNVDFTSQQYTMRNEILPYLKNEYALPHLYLMNQIW